MMIKKKHLTYKEGEFAGREETEEAAFVVRFQLIYIYNRLDLLVI
jgi:hypothetical protein